MRNFHTGTTVISIINLIKQHFPLARFKVFTLAKSDYDSSLNTSLQLAGTDYTWGVNSGWMVAEDEGEYNNYISLCDCILKDNFAES